MIVLFFFSRILLLFLHFNGGVMRSILLWLLGVPIPIIILLALFWH
jgi:hypothetical protein